MHIWKDSSIYLDLKTVYLAKVIKGFGLTNAKFTNRPLSKGYHPILNTDTVDT